MALVAPLLSLSRIGKRFGAVRALEGIDLDIHAGDVLGICGDNGAGKSTLIRILSGAETPSEGRITLDGTPVRFRSPADALRSGIATTYQDLALAPRLSIAENVFMGGELLRRPALFGLLDKRRMRRDARAYLSRFNFSVTDMRRPVAALSGGQRQAVALARALRWNARIVIMDEPTAALGVQEGRAALELIRSLHRDGVTVILISHNMDDVIAVTTRVAILKNGRKVGELATSDTNPDHLAHTITTGMLRPA